MRMRKLARGRGRQLLGVSVFYLGWRLLKERSLSTPFCDSPWKAIMACFEPLPLMRMIYTNLPYITNLDSSNRLESNASLADVFALDHISVSMEKEDNSCCKICRVVGAWLLCYNSRLLLVSRSLTPRQESGYARLICFGGDPGRTTRWVVPSVLDLCSASSAAWGVLWQYALYGSLCRAVQTWD